MRCNFCKQLMEKIEHNDPKIDTYKCNYCHYLIDISVKDRQATEDN